MILFTIYLVLATVFGITFVSTLAVILIDKIDNNKVARSKAPSYL